MSTSVADPVGSARRTWRVDAGLLALLAVLIRLPGLLANGHLTFDDSVYGAAAMAMRAGAEPFRDIFSSQGPLHLPLIYIFDLIGFRTLDAPRLLPLCSGVVITVATYAIARRLTSRYGAVVAALLVTTSGSILFVTVPITGDGPAIALSSVAVLLALRYRDLPTTPRAVAVGIAIGAALCVKLLVLPAALVVGLLLLSSRRWRDLSVAIAATVVVFFASALPWGLDEVWNQNVAYHQDAKRVRSVGGNVARMFETLAERDVWVITALVLSLATIGWFAWRRRTADGSSPPEEPRTVPLQTAAWALVAWGSVQMALLAVEPAMWRPHVSQLIVPLALLAVLRPAPWPALAIAALAVSPVYWSHAQPMLQPDGYNRAQQRIVDRIEQLPDDALVIADDPGLVWRADHRTPSDLTDTSIKRIMDHDLTTETVARATRRADVCAVVVWAPDRFGSLTELPDRLEDAGYHVAARFDGPRAVYTRGRCG